MNINHNSYQKLIDDQFRQLLHSARKYLSSSQTTTIKLAFQVADHAHFGQFRKSGEPYITHPLEVAILVTNWKLDEQTIAGALMHDIVEDTLVSTEDLDRIFGPNIAGLVDSLTKLDKLHFESEEIAHAEYFRKVVLAMAKDIRVILIKLADRMHNMLTLESMRSEKRKKIALETFEIYMPIAHKIGLYKVHLDLAEESFKYIYPYRYRVLSKAVESAHQTRSPLTQEILQNIKNALKSNGIIAQFKYRPKTIYSIYHRMLKRKQSFSRIYDIFEIKIITENIGHCYLVLGVLHNLYQPLPNKFKDYIALPKTNGYQSLHSTMMGPNGLPIQIHICTREMDEIAEYGIISRGLNQQKNGMHQLTKQPNAAWINNILDIQSSTFSATDFLDNIKKDLSPENTYTFTPKGKIIHLPRGSTPIDFAYTIHTDIGDHFSKAKINQKIVKDNHQLQNGDLVEIITDKHSEPQEKWLQFVVTGRAISKIKQFLKEQKHEENINNGMHLLNLGIAITGSNLEISDALLKPIVKKHHRKLSLVEFKQKIGLNEISTLEVVKELLKIKSSEVLKIKLSNCNLPVIQDDYCYPLAGEEVLALINRAGKLEFHRIQCSKNKTTALDKLTLITIINDTEAYFLCKILLVINNQPGVFSKLSSILARRKVNMEEILQERHESYAIVRLTISVKSVQQADELITIIAKNDFVEKIHRV